MCRQSASPYIALTYGCSIALNMGGRRKAVNDKSDRLIYPLTLRLNLALIIGDGARSILSN
jgi:hypothetical protein